MLLPYMLVAFCAISRDPAIYAIVHDFLLAILCLLYLLHALYFAVNAFALLLYACYFAINAILPFCTYHGKLTILLLITHLPYLPLHLGVLIDP